MNTHPKYEPSRLPSGFKSICGREVLVPKNIRCPRGPHSTMDSVLALHPAAPGLIPGVNKNVSARAVDSRGIIMLIKLFSYWLEASWDYKEKH